MGQNENRLASWMVGALAPCARPGPRSAVPNMGWNKKSRGQANAVDRLAAPINTDSLGHRAATGDEKNHPAYDANTADNRSNGQAMLVLFVNLQWAEFRYVFLGGVAGEPAVGENNDSDDD